MKRRVIGITVAVLLAVLGTFVLTAWVGTAEQRALAGVETTQVYLVSEDVPRGATASELEGKVRLEQIPAKARAEDAITDLGELGERIAAVDLVAGEQLLATRFVAPAELEAMTQVEVPDGLHQVTVLLDPQRALGGNVRPGDTVGVVSSFDPFLNNGADGNETPNSTQLILHKVLVTNVQVPPASGTTGPVGGEGDDETGEQTPPPPPGGSLLVTLAIDQESVERLVFTAEHGRLWLTAEPEEAPEPETPIRTRTNVYGEGS